MLNLDIMSRRLPHIGPTVMAVWVLIFSITAPLGLVICVGDDGHLALERDHERGHRFHTPADVANITHGDCGDCSDTPVLLFYGRVRTAHKQSSSQVYIIHGHDALSRLLDQEQNKLNEKTPIRNHYPINYPISLSTVILKC